MRFDWQHFHAGNNQTVAVVDPRRRLWICLTCFVVLLLLVLGRAVQLEVSQGAGFRAQALRPVEKETVLPATRGRILARDGSTLACGKTVQAVALQYRWFQEPPDARWLRSMARMRLTKADRKIARKLAEAKAAVIAERADLAARLANRCGVSPEQWAARVKHIQARVERIAASANRRRQSDANDANDADDSWAGRIRRLLLEDPAPPRIIVAEELASHVVADDVEEATVAEINEHADRYPGAMIVERSQRTYPAGQLAVHVLGHLGRVDEDDLAEQAFPPVPGQTGMSAPPPRLPHLPDDFVGRMGVERQYEIQLQGHRGAAILQTDRGGRCVASYHANEPIAGRDVTVTLDMALQRTAEELLQSALERRSITAGTVESSGGAIVVIDIRDGSVRAAASAPTFDPNLFGRGKPDQIAALLADKAHPLFNRVCSMAIPPGSTFKVLTAIALLESGTIGSPLKKGDWLRTGKPNAPQDRGSEVPVPLLQPSPQEPFECQGYLHQPDRQRCEIFVRHGIGHGQLDLSDALAESCNVYFLHFADQMGPKPLLDWANRFGFGRPTRIDLPSEAAGTLPDKRGQNDLSAINSSDPFYQAAIGQGSLTATPLQVVRMMAAVANGGKLVTPHVVERVEQRRIDDPMAGEPPCPRKEESIRLSSRTLRSVREGLRRVVADPKGTAHGTVYIESIAVAGKTGTAETGEDRSSHAWFAGYVPADNPKLAFVVVLEHAGDAGTAAGPIAKRLVLRMEQLGML